MTNIKCQFKLENLGFVPIYNSIFSVKAEESVYINVYWISDGNYYWIDLLIYIEGISNR